MGHRTTHEVIQCFFHDRDPLDDIEPNSGGTGNDDDEIEESGIGSSTTQATTDSVLEPENDELEYNNYGYSGIEQREEGEEEEEEEEDGDENGDEADEKENINRDDDAIVDDELGMEDGENDDKELDGFDEF
jgi:hypothetical protein